MRIVSRIDARGFFVEDVILGDDGPPPAGCVEERPLAGFDRPRWNGSGWEEGEPKTEARIVEETRDAKRAELARAFVGAQSALYPEVDPAHAVWLAVPEYAASPNGQRPQAIRANVARLRGKLAAVEAAATIEAVGAVSW